MRAVYIIESGNPSDFFELRLDGNATQGILNILGVTNKLRYVLNTKQFKSALSEMSKSKFDVLHLSCHGDKEGIQLANKTDLDWDEFANCVAKLSRFPKALVMSSCCGADSGITHAFKKIKNRPEIIFGPTQRRAYGELATAWTILYHEFSKERVDKEIAQRALRYISATVHTDFYYRRWKAETGSYWTYPRSNKRYEVVER